jgi:hypothetical protein
MTNILYTYNIQIQNKAAFFVLLRVDLHVHYKMGGFYNNSDL